MASLSGCCGTRPSCLLNVFVFFVFNSLGHLRYWSLLSPLLIKSFMKQLELHFCAMLVDISATFLPHLNQSQILLSCCSLNSLLSSTPLCSSLSCFASLFLPCLLFKPWQLLSPLSLAACPFSLYTLSTSPLVPSLLFSIFHWSLSFCLPATSLCLLLYSAVLSSLPWLFQMLHCGPWDRWWRETVGIRVCVNVCVLLHVHTYVRIWFPVHVCTDSIFVCVCVYATVCVCAVLIHPIDQSRTPDSHHPWEPSGRRLTLPHPHRSWHPINLLLPCIHTCVCLCVSQWISSSTWKTLLKGFCVAYNVIAMSVFLRTCLCVHVSLCMCFKSKPHTRECVHAPLFHPPTTAGAEGSWRVLGN